MLFISGHDSIPYVKLLQTSWNSINISTRRTDIYELNGVLRYLLVYSQHIHTPTNDSTMNLNVTSEVLEAFDVTGFNEGRFPVDHSKFFSEDVHHIHMSNLSANTFYALYVLYETTHTIGNATEMFVVKTKEYGK